MAGFPPVSFDRTPSCLLLLTVLVACGGTSTTIGRGGTGDGNPAGGHGAANPAIGGTSGGSGAGHGGAAGDTTTTATGGQGADPGSGGATTSTGATTGAAGAGNNPFPIPPGSTGHPVNCNVPAVPAPTTPEGRERAALIHTHCSSVLAYPCLGNLAPGEVSESATTCSSDVRATACELDDTLEYSRSIPGNRSGVGLSA